MKNATRGLVAGGLGVALLAGGATFALWSDDANVDGGVITSGNLDISVGDQLWYDTSEDVYGDVPKVIEIDEFLTVPGDTLRMTQQVTLDLEGDNIGAELVASYPGVTGDAAFLAATYGLSGEYTLLDKHGEALGSVALLGDGDSVKFDELGRDHSGTYTLQLDIEFDSNEVDEQGQTNTKKRIELGDIALNLTQVRPTP